MSRKERRAKARREKIENLYHPVKANKWALIAIATVVVIAFIASFLVKYSN